MAGDTRLLLVKATGAADDQGQIDAIYRAFNRNRTLHAAMEGTKVAKGTGAAKELLEGAILTQRAGAKCAS